MALLAETFNKDFTVQRVEIYARALAEYPIESSRLRSMKAFAASNFSQTG